MSTSASATQLLSYLRLWPVYKIRNRCDTFCTTILQGHLVCFESSMLGLPCCSNMSLFLKEKELHKSCSHWSNWIGSHYLHWFICSNVSPGWSRLQWCLAGVVSALLHALSWAWDALWTVDPSWCIHPGGLGFNHDSSYNVYNICIYIYTIWVIQVIRVILQHISASAHFLIWEWSSMVGSSRTSTRLFVQQHQDQPLFDKADFECLGALWTFREVWCFVGRHTRFRKLKDWAKIKVPMFLGYVSFVMW